MAYTRGPQWGENYDTTLDGFNPFKAIGKLASGVVKVAGSALGLTTGQNEIKVNLDSGKLQAGIVPANQTPVQQAQQALSSVPTAVWVAGGVAAVALLLSVSGRKR